MSLVTLDTDSLRNISEFLGVYEKEPDLYVDERIPGISVLTFVSKQFQFLKHLVFGWFDHGEDRWTFHIVNYLGYPHGPALTYETSDWRPSGIGCWFRKQQIGTWTRRIGWASNRTEWNVQGNSVCWKVQHNMVQKLLALVPLKLQPR